MHAARVGQPHKGSHCGHLRCYKLKLTVIPSVRRHQTTAKGPQVLLGCSHWPSRKLRVSLSPKQPKESATKKKESNHIVMISKETKSFSGVLMESNLQCPKRKGKRCISDQAYLTLLRFDLLQFIKVIKIGMKICIPPVLE